MKWFKDEFKAIDLGDKRLNRRLMTLTDKLSRNSTESIPTACNHWSEIKAAYRFFDNKKVTSEKILKPHIDATIKRIAEEKVVLLIQDTTELNYSNQKEKQGVGPSHRDNDLVLHLHPLVAVTPEKVCLGIIDDYSWHRKELHRKTKSKQEVNSKNMHCAIEEKESFRWLQGYHKSCEIAEVCQQTQIICVGDRESDIFDIYHDEAQRGDRVKSNWLVRGRMNRALVDAQGKRKSHLLFDEINQTKAVGSLIIKVPKRGRQKARVANVQVKINHVTLHPPTGRRGKLRLLPVKAIFIKVDELNTPKGEEPVDWLLLTNLYGDGFEDAKKFINWYLCRWQIEVFFKIVKSGCTIEKIQITEPNRFLPCLTLYLIIAWRILFLTMTARKNPDISCELFFSKAEWQLAFLAVKNKYPVQPPLLYETLTIIAKLGGYIGRKSDGPPGVKTIWLGLRDLSKIILGHELSQKSLN